MLSCRLPLLLSLLPSKSPRRLGVWAMVLADAYLLLSLDLMLPVLARERPPSRVDKEGEEAAAGGRGQRAAGEEQNFASSPADFSSDVVASLFSSQDQVNSVVNAVPTNEEEEAAINLAQINSQRWQQQQRLPPHQRRRHQQRHQHHRPRPQLHLPPSRWQQQRQQPLPRPQWRPNAFPRPRLQATGGRSPASPKSPTSIARFDEYGDYDFVDVRRVIERPFRPTPDHPHSNRWRHSHPGRNGVRRGSHAQRRPQPHHHHPPPAPSNLHRPHPHHYVHRPQQSHFSPHHHQLQQHPQGNYGPHFLPPYKRPFALANSVLKWVGLEALPFIKVIPEPGETATSLEEEADDFGSFEPAYNSIEADYYADYEGGAFYRPPSPPTTLDRVTKWFDGFKPPRDFLKPGKRRKKKNKGNRRKLLRPGGSGSDIDYDLYETGEDQNLIFYGSGESGSSPSPGASGEFDFLDVLNSIRSNETIEVTAKKFFSAASSLSERTETSPGFLFWTVPTTIFAVLGLVYIVSAIAIVAYQNTLGSGTNTAIIIPTIIAFSIPAVIAFVFVTSRASVKGELDVQQVMRGDVRNALTTRFDGVDYLLDGAFGALSLLGVGWMASVLV